MLDFVLIVAIVIAAVATVILMAAATKPNAFHVARAIAIKAPRERIFALVNDFHNWRAWSPYENKDPEMKRSYGGAPSGAGATYDWEGNRAVGKGHMEIVESTPGRIAIKLHFMAPMEARNTAEFKIEPDGETNTVTWSIYGPNTFMGKVASVFMNMDRMIGADFETGLRNLKALAEN